MNSVGLSEAIRDFLLTKCLTVYKSKASPKAQFPYITFKLPSSYDTNPSEDFTLEVNVWDDAKDTTALENLADIIDGTGKILNPTGLNRRTIIFDGLTATFYREARGWVDDDDPNINRRQLRYRVRVYYEGE